jgi:hypothetical protein
MRFLKYSLGMLAALAFIQPAQAQRAPGLQPSEDVWQPAETPAGGVSWAVLESAEEIQREQYGLVYSRPNFPSQVKALQGKTIKVNGYMLPLQNGARQTHFVLLAYPPDCPFHLNPAPDQFIEVRVSSPVPVENGVVTVEGTLVLSGEDESGIFYQMTNARTVG